MLKEGLQLPFGIQPVNPVPVDTWSGPYTDITEALSSIPIEIRFPTMEVRILNDVSGNAKYWFKNGVQDSDLIPFGYDLTNVISGETIARIDGDVYLFNLITGLTDNKFDKTGGTITGNVIITGGTISGDGSGLYNIPASGVTGIDSSKWEYEIVPSSTTLHPRWNDSGNVNIYGTDRFNFNLFPTSFRNGIDGTYSTGLTSILGGGAYLWTNSDYRLGIYAGYSAKYLSNYYYLQNGYGIRLVKNTTTNEQILLDGTIIHNAYNDNDGNVYDATKIGNQLWLTKNLCTKTYLDGTPILTNLTNSEWASNTIGAMAIYPTPFDGITTESQMIEAYGILYNGYTISNPSKLVNDSTGWHVPSAEEYSQMFNYLYSTYPEITSSNIGNVLKSKRQVTSPYVITNLIPKDGYHIDANIIDNLPVDYLPLSGGNLYGDLEISNGIFVGDGSGLYNIAASGVTGLNLDRITSGYNSATMTGSGLTINTGVTVQGNIDIQSLTIISSGLTTNLNADLLDGYHSYDLTGATISEADLRYVNVTGDTMTGSLTLSGISSTFKIVDGANTYFQVNNVVNDSNFIGKYAGIGAFSARHSNFLGDYTGSGATYASYSNFIGQSTGGGAINASYSNFLGQGAGFRASGASNSNFLGHSAGILAYNAGHSNFLGQNAGGDSIGGSFSNFIGYYAGNAATYASGSTFLGKQAGEAATNAKNSNFLGDNAGSWATNAKNSNFLGDYAGSYAASASYSTLIGYKAGYNATGSIGSNNIIIGINISLPSGTTNSMNLGGVLFGTGFYATATGNPLTGVTSGGRIGIGTRTPISTLDVSGNTNISGNVTGNTFVKSGGTFDQYLMADGSVTTTGATQAYYDSRYVNVTGDTIAGKLNIVGNEVSGSTVLSVESSNNKILQITSDGYFLENSATITGITDTITIYQINKFNTSAAFIDYRVSNSIGGFRAGTMTLVWDGTNVEFTEYGTSDLNNSTSGITLTSDINGDYVRLLASITSGVWSVKIGVRVL